MPLAARRVMPGLVACLLPWSAGQALAHAPSCHRQTVVLTVRDGRAFVLPRIDGQDTARRAGVAPDGPPDSVAAGLAPGSALRAWNVTVPDVALGDGAAAAMPMMVVDKPHANADMFVGLDVFIGHRMWIDRSRHVLILENGPRS